MDFNDLIERAARFGLDVYAYSYYRSDKHPSDPDAKEHYESTYGRLFREYPGFKGVTLVGESVEFPSNDTHVSPGRLNDTAIDGIPTGKVTAGWYPCEDYPEWISMIASTVRQYKEDADIVFWTYNWGFQPEEARLKLIESLPNNISVQATFEMFEPKLYEASKGFCADYTLSFEGPGKYFASEAAAAKKKGIKLYSMTNTGGLTWDFGVVPYEPAPFQWMRRYEAMKKAHDEWGLCGIMESHHYGFYPSFISKLSKHAFLEPCEDMNEILKKVVSSEFGAANTQTVIKALEDFSEAIRYYTPTDADQYGAFRVGASYPFWVGGGSNIPLESRNDICVPVYSAHVDHRQSPVSIRIRDQIKSLEKMLFLMNSGISALKEIEDKNENLLRLINLTEFMANAITTGIHAKKWYVLKCKANVEENAEKLSEIFDDMETLLLEEIENAKAAIPLVENDSRLGFEPYMMYMTTPWQIDWKIRQVNYVIDIELKKMRASLATHLK